MSPQAPPPSSSQQPEAQPPVSFWQQAWVQNILPFVTSLAVHSGIVVLAIVFATVVVKTVVPKGEIQTRIPISELAPEGDIGGVFERGIHDDPFRKTTQNNDPDGGTPDGWAPKKGPLDAEMTLPGGGTGEESAALIGIGPGGLGKGNHIGTGKGNEPGGGDGDGRGAQAMFGPTNSGGGFGPKSVFVGHGSNVRKIAFVCDASGSMISKMASLKNELNKSVAALKPIQSFNLIFFQGNSALPMSRESLVGANNESKRLAFKYLDDVTTSDTSDPCNALRLAFKQQPQLIYLLTDGDFPDNGAVLAEVRKLNANHSVKINTIAFVNDKDTDTAFIDLLTTIAKENGGTFKHVAENELNN